MELDGPAELFGGGANTKLLIDANMHIIVDGSWQSSW